MSRITSTLYPPKEFALTKAQRRVGFAALYLGTYDGLGFELATKMFVNLIMPWTRGVEFPTPKAYRELMQASVRDKAVMYDNAVESKLAKHMPTKTFNLVSTFVSMVPDEETHFNPSNWQSLQSFVLDNLVPKNTEVRQHLRSQFTEKFEPVQMTGKEWAAIVNTSARNKDIIATSVAFVAASLNTNEAPKVKVQYVIPKHLAEFINSSSFLEIKLGNFYQLLLDWQMSLFAQVGSVAQFSTPISKIAESIEGVPAKPRTDADSLVIDQSGDYYWIPQVDNSKDYEQQLQEFGLQEDGSYSMRPEKVPVAQTEGPQSLEIDPTAPRVVSKPKHLPANVPILTDWLNGKFAYSNTVGRLQVMDLEETQPIKAYHIREILNKDVYMTQAVFMLGIIGTAVQRAMRLGFNILAFKPAPDEMEPARLAVFNKTSTGDFASTLFGAMRTLLMREAGPVGRDDEDDDSSNREDIARRRKEKEEMQELVVPAGTKLQDYTGIVGFGATGVVCKVHDFNSKSALLPLRFIGRMFEAAAKFSEDNITAMYRQFAVMSTSESIACLKIFAKYAKDYDGVVKLDKQQRSKYLTQGLDPAYKVKPLPLVRTGPNPEDCLVLQPHQARAENMLRDNPDNAVLDVDAGGGKTIIILKDVIKSLSNGECKRPCVLCPAHLVNQYVSEVVYMTGGRLNIVPLTNVSMKLHGEDRLRDMVEKAPINTVFVIDLNFVKARPLTVAYGNKAVQLFRNVEFLRSLEFDMVFVDESQYLANMSSTRRTASAKFLLDVAKKRIASGTLLHNTILDLVSQFALFDSTIFGTREQFIAKYAQATSGAGKVLAWKPGMEAEVHAKMEQFAVFCTARRKEWAALLPKPREKFWFVNMTENQASLYKQILDEVTELIKAAIAKNAELKELMESDDDTKAEMLEAILRPYLARLEAFLSAPELDAAGSFYLQNPEDRISPKVAMVYERIRAHFELGIPGKVLIFTNYVKAAESVWENAPPDLQEKMILYTADRKMECRADFEKNDKMTIMVGVSSSMDTGLNFQHVSRLIRMETLWTPGGLEQGNSRVNRPQLKALEARKDIYFDWIAVNRSIDITKISRLVSKIISKAKFDNSKSEAYQAIDPYGELVPITMSLETIQAQNDFELDLKKYLEGYQDLAIVQQQDYDEYARTHKDDKPELVEHAGPIPGSKLMSRVPYVPGMDIYKAADLGLVRYDEFMRQDAASLEADEDSDEDEDEKIEDDDLPTTGVGGKELLTPRQRQREALRLAIIEERIKVKNRPVHTEFGDGTLRTIGRVRAHVLYPDGTKRVMSKMQIFMITRSTTNGKDLRNQLLKQVGEIPIDKPITVPVETGTADKKRKKLKRKGKDTEKDDVDEDTKDDQMDVELEFTIINDHLAIKPINIEDNAVISALSNFGFRSSPLYWYARIKKPLVLKHLFEGWKAKGFTYGNQASSTFGPLYKALAGKPGALRQFGLSKSLDLQNYLQGRVYKPTTNQKEINPFPQLQDGVLYVCLMVKGQAGTAKAKLVKPDGITWIQGGGESEILRFCKTHAEAASVIQDIVEAGFNIVNLKNLKADFKTLKQRVPNRDSKDKV